MVLFSSPPGVWATESSNEPNECSSLPKNVHVENPQVNFNEQSVHVHAHDPAVTSLVEATAELCHREMLTQAQAQAEAIHRTKTEELMEDDGSFTRP